jgi:hypothetical protein
MPMSQGSSSSSGEPAGGAQRSFLNVGSGPKDSPFVPPWLRTPDWREVRLDIDPNLNPDIVASATDMHEVADASFDAVWAANIVEHLFAHEVPTALREFARVTKPDGLTQVLVPDLQRVAAMIVEGKLEEAAFQSTAGPIAPIDILFGFRRAIAQGRIHMAHKTGFIASTLEMALRRSGFKHVAVFHLSWDLLALASQTLLTDVWMPSILRESCMDASPPTAPQ